MCKLGVAFECSWPPDATHEDSTRDSTGSQESHASHVAQRMVERNHMRAQSEMGGAGLEPAATCV